MTLLRTFSRPVPAIAPALLVVTLACMPASAAVQHKSDKPNIVYILCDDLGYGDVHCLNPERGKIATPHMDRLASQGMVFTDAHGGSSVCTPTRYGILTGRYSWRSRLQSFVLMGDGKPLISPERLTVARLLKQNGYTTACIGKWHLGLDIPLLAGGPPAGKSKQWQFDYAGRIAGGPLALGFDRFFGISGSLDMWPFIYIDGDRFTALPTTEKRWVQVGPAAADFEAVDTLPTLTTKAVECIRQSAAGAKTGKPLFLYLPLNSPHTPILPTAEWKGKSGLNEYADFVMQTDWSIGQVLAELDRQGLADNTLVIVTSDNGCSPSAKIDQLQRAGHYPSAHLRGHKADIFDGGHRVPFLVRWPGKVKAGVRSDQLICLADLMATCAEMLGQRLPDNAGEDSVSILPALLGTARQPLREAVVHHSVDGRFAIRQGRWKLSLCPGSGGWSKPKDGDAEEAGMPRVQLYDMTDDVGEQKNLQGEQAEVAARLKKLLEKYVAEGRSTPGTPQKNDVAIDIIKKNRKSKKAGS